MIKIVFFDIDGTLLNFGAPDMSPRVRRALTDLQERGIRIFLATGRPPYTVPEFPGITFDGKLCFNGGYCFDREGEIFSGPIDPVDMGRVIENAKAMGMPVMIATLNRMGSNFFQEALEEYMQISHHPCTVLPDYDEVLKEKVYQLMVGSTPDQDEALIAGTSRVKVARWWERAMDVIPADCGKANAIRHVLEHYGLSREEAMAFGDGGNDLDMIEYVGLGVAMGNAEPEVKAAADYVTDGCAEDGVYSALRHR